MLEDVKDVVTPFGSAFDCLGPGRQGAACSKSSLSYAPSKGADD